MPVKVYDGTNWVTVAGDGAAGAPGTNGTNGIDATPYAAGKNKVINGDFGIWQRGTTFTNPAVTAYTADRWQVQHDGTGATRTVSQQTFTPGSAPVAGYEGQYFYRYAVSVTGTGNTFQDFRTNLEDVRTFAGQTVTISFWAKADASRVVDLLYRTEYGSGGSSANQFSVGSVTLTTSWVRYTVTYAVPSVSGLTIGAGSFGGWIFRPPAATVQTIDIWGVQVEAGSTATAFQTATGTIQGELAACQRYYYRPISTSAYGPLGVGQCTTTTSALIYHNFPVVMRATPTFSGASMALTGSTGSAIGVSSLSLWYGNPYQVVSTVNVASGLVAGNATIMVGSNFASAYVEFSAEL